MTASRRIVALVVAVLGVAAAPAHASSLAGSRSSMTRQHDAAVELDYRFARTPAQVRKLADAGALVRVSPDTNLTLADVSFPYAQPEVRGFVQHLAAQYRAATGSRLVITSLTRPTALQPGNASPLSVHPAGMAVDLRVPASDSARRWLERTLLALEDENVLDVTREQRPPHFHVAVFPDAARAWAARQDSVQARAAAERAVATTEEAMTLEPAVVFAEPANGSGTFAAAFAALLAVGTLWARVRSRRPREVASAS